MTKNNIFILSLLMTVGFSTTTFAGNSKSISEIQVIQEVKHDVSRPLRDMAPLKESGPNYVVPLFHYPASLYTDRILKQPFEDQALQTIPPATLDVPVVGFQGIGVGLGNFTPRGVPPDPTGAAGLTQYVQWVNSSYAVFDKATGNVLAGFPKAGNAIWQGFGGLCETTNRGDPIVEYDQLADRWVMSQFAFTSTSTPPFYQCIAVSTTSDATGTYNRYAFQFDGFNDYGKLGVWSDAYYMSFNIFGGPNSGPRACAADRTKMMAGLAATMQCTHVPNSGTVLPPALYGKALPPAGTPGYFLTFRTPSTLNLFRYHVDFAIPANSTFTGPTSITVANFATANRAPQPGTTTTLDTLSDRLMMRLAYRQFPTYGSMLANHSIRGTSGAAAVRWYEIRFNTTGTPSLYQQGTFSPDATNRFMGSIAMDKAGNIAVGYSESSASLFPSISIATRVPSDPLGTMTMTQRIITGTGSQTGISRWGDYTSMTIDPVDDCTFWYTNEYLKTNGSFNWSTHIDHFVLPNCTSTTTDIPLQNNVPINNLSGIRGDQKYYYIDVPAGRPSLTIKTFGGTGDSDLYVQFGQRPTTTLWQCRPYTSGTNETCTFTPPQTGRYYIMIRAYANYSGVSLQGNY